MDQILLWIIFCPEVMVTVKNLNFGFVSLHKMLTGVVWTGILTAPIHCRGSIGEQMRYMLLDSPNL